MEVDAKAIVETLQIFTALVACVSAGVELFKKIQKEPAPQKTTVNKEILSGKLCYSR